MPAPSRAAPGPAARRVYPLSLACRMAGVAPPAARPIAAGHVPRPYRALLVHDRDMTPTLERHFGARLTVRPLAARARGRWYLRQVLLSLEGHGRPVAMGAMRIRLDVLPERIRRRILRGEVPFGRVLREGRQAFRSVPRRFLRVTPSPAMLGVFWLASPRALYGRQTDVTLDGRKFGDVIEILPPL